MSQTNFSPKKVSIVFLIFVLLFLVGFYILAWQEPTTAPPGGNVPAPINVSSTAQTKAGRLGIGVSSVDPNYLLTVGTGQGVKITNTGSQPSLYVEDDISDSTPFIITAAGNVGIGTTSPTSPLHVVYSGNTYINFQNTSSGTFGGFVLYNGSTPVYFATNGSMLSFFVGDGSQQDMVITNAGNVGIGTTAPATKLEVQGGALCVRSGTGVSCNTTSGAVSAQYFYYISDLRLKTNIQPIENALSRLLTLDGISYETTYDGSRSLGLIAQEVEKVFPEVVNTDKETGLKWIDYGKLVPVLIQAIKEQQKEIEKLKLEIELLKDL